MARWVSSHFNFAIVLSCAIACTTACRRGADGAADAAPAASASASASASVIEATPPPLPDTSVPFDELDEPDETADASFGDATVTDATGDVGDADARDARAKPDVGDDAPLMGTKTFPDEEPQKGFRYITTDAAKVHKAPKDGKAFMSIPRGTQVFLIAKQYEWFRVRFVDPSLGTARQGWIFRTNIVGPPMKSCPEGWTHHDTDCGWCERECTKNTDCKGLPGWKCSGDGCFYAVQE